MSNLGLKRNNAGSVLVVERRIRSSLLQGSWEGAWEYAHSVYLCCVILEKAYDRVLREILWEVLREYGVRGALLRAIQFLYTQSEICVRVPGTKSSLFRVLIGLHKSCVVTNPVCDIHGQDIEV